MSRTIGRRDFIKTSAGAGLTLAMGKALAAASAGAAKARAPVVGVGISDDYGRATAKAVGLAGGIKRFVPKGAKVALLPNVQSRHPGSFTKPEVLRAKVTSPGGTTAAAMTSLRESQVFESIVAGVAAAFQRSRELGA